ncbi:hypothetical protein MMC17_007059 [Xylographa soralifera]|nr:hypothetical protein [Xylographa soralifera]
MSHASVEDQDLRGSRVWADVHQYFNKLHSPAFGQIINAVDLSATPDGARIAFTGIFRHNLQDAPTTRICILHVGLKSVETLTRGPNNDRLPQWSRDGQILAFLSDRDEEGAFQLFILQLNKPEGVRRTPRINGSVEHFQWSLDNSKILMGASMNRAGTESASTIEERDSNRIPKADWMPAIKSGNVNDLWRTLWLFDLEVGTLRSLNQPRENNAPAWNVWEASWCGSDRLATIVSERPQEGEWYESKLALMQVDTGVVDVIYRPRRQLSFPVCSPSTGHIAVIEGLSSDRGCVAGNILCIDISNKSLRRLDTNHVDVLHATWEVEDSLLVMGIRGFFMVAGVVHLSENRFEELWSTDEASGYFIPEVTWLGDRAFAIVIESWTRHPEIAIISPGSFSTLKSFDHEGAAWLRAQLGESKALAWIGPDDIEIQGLLYLPKDIAPPYSLILNVHGGPVLSFRNNWPGDSYIALLVSRGFAVLNVNPRGSCGRGQHFAELIVGNFGGDETRDHLAGIELLESQGLVDSNKLGVTGSSHGGFMASWIITQSDRFAASLPISAITNWHSLQLTSNISPHFGATFLSHTPGLHSIMNLMKHSPVSFAGTYPTPVLQIAGQEDLCALPSQALEYHRACQTVESTVVIYPGEGHGIVSGHLAYLDMCVRAVMWFERFIPPE